MFVLPPIDLLTVALFIGLLGLALVTDVVSLRIPNRVCLAIAGIYPAHVLASPTPVDWLGGIGVAAAFFAAGLIFFSLRWMGGGDVKLLAAVALWAGPPAALELAIFTTLTGGALALLLMSPWRFALAQLCESVGRTDVRQVLLGRSIPYGVAIAAGAGIAVAPRLLGL